MKTIFSKILPFIAIVLMVVSCGDDELTTSERLTNAAENYAAIVVASYDDSYEEAETLRDMINDFVDAPTSAKFDACKAQWLKARTPYGQTEIYRFYGGPIDNETDGPEGLINAWPMDEGFIDYIESDPSSGLINDADTYPEITKDVLTNLNESISEASIFTGYHAIEFLLWGQDFSTNGPGTRPWTDYLTDGNGTASNQDRRGQYLKTVADLLLDHLNQVRNQWGSSGAFQQQFLAQSKDDILTDIFTSLGELSKGELSGERMFVAVDSKDQENEHSCFADNTIDDIVQNFNGIVNVYTGSYTRTDGSTVSGESYSAIASDLDAEKADAVTNAITEARTKINAIPSPFDQAILNNGPTVIEAVTALEDLSDRFADVEVVLKAN
ncbi:MAG: imelysin family protein [Bacteroidota bacterium]